MSDAGIDDIFDFERHQKNAISAYLLVKPFYEELSSVVARIIEECLGRRLITVHSVQHRAKDPVSFGRKSSIPSNGNPEKPKYEEPLSQITDLAGVRVITNVRQTIADVDGLLHDEFDVVERSDKGKILLDEDKFGYHSVHYLIKISGSRASLAEYERYSHGMVEVQVRTILQHAWAEIEHDIQYKSSYSIPSEIRRRFMSLAGMLEVADREFEAIQSADRELSAIADDQVKVGKLSGVEITPRSLKSFLDKRLGPDGRMSDWSYDWASRNLKKLGFLDLKQVEVAIISYDDVELSRIAEGARLGQVGRFEYMLLAALGENFIQRHPWGSEPWFKKSRRQILEKFKNKGVSVGHFDPTVK
jgi:putative GTP pyrophosphokinase